MFGLSCSKELAAELEVALREAAADRSAHASYSSRYWPRTRSSEMDSSAMVDENLVTCKY